MVILFLSAIPLIQAQTCKDVYYFIIDNLDYNGKINYTDEDFTQLINQTNSDNHTILNMIQNYSEICGNETGLEIPKPDIPTIDFPKNNLTYCNTKINDSLMGFDLDSSWTLGFGDGIIVDIKCQEIQQNKKWFGYKEVGGNYAITGIKLWWVLTLIGTFITLIFVIVMISALRSDRKMQDYLNRRLNV